jgi:uncharacterized MAPEG superfamily protein
MQTAILAALSKNCQNSSADPARGPAMTSELTFLTWTLVLALIQIVVPATLRTRETGSAYNAGPRDEEGPPVGTHTGRFQRAQRNLFETLPIFAAAVLVAHLAGKNGSLTYWGACLYFWARVVYLPLYALGVPYLRSAVWLLCLVGVILILVAALLPA